MRTSHPKTQSNIGNQPPSAGLTRQPVTILKELALLREFLYAEQTKLSEVSLVHFNTPELPHTLLQVEAARRSVSERIAHMHELQQELGSGLPPTDYPDNQLPTPRGMRDIALAQFEHARSVCSAHYTRGTVRVMERWRVALEWASEQYQTAQALQAHADHAAAVSGM